MGSAFARAHGLITLNPFSSSTNCVTAIRKVLSQGIVSSSAAVVVLSSDFVCVLQKGITYLLQPLTNFVK